MALVAKNGFRNDDFHPYLYKTTDFGKTWMSLGQGLPEAPVNVVVQDRQNANLLVVGTDLGVWVSLDGGKAWQRLKGNLPTVPVHDLTIHPRENDLVLGTYGRGLFVGDFSIVQQMSSAVLAEPFHVFRIEPRTPYGFRAQGNYHLFGSKYIEVPNEPDAITIAYYLQSKQEAQPRITIADVSGQQVAQLTGPGEAGVNTVLWNMRRGGGPAGGRGGPGGRGGAGPLMPAGEYRVTVEAAGEQQMTVARIRERR
jgi:hypothetical protein